MRNGSHVEVKALSGAGGLFLDAAGQADLFVELELQGGEILITAGDGDGFLKKILPSEGFGNRLLI